MIERFIIAQILGFLAFGVMLFAIQCKNKQKLVFFYMIANSIITIEYFLLGAITGGVVYIVTVIRCLVFWLYSLKNKRASIYVLIVLEVATLVCGIVSWQGILSLIPIGVAIIYTYGLWQENLLVVKITAGISSLGWLVYNLFVKAYVSAVQEVFIVISSVVAIVMLVKGIKKKESLMSIKELNVEERKK